MEKLTVQEQNPSVCAAFSMHVHILLHFLMGMCANAKSFPKSTLYCMGQLPVRDHCQICYMELFQYFNLIILFLCMCI